MTTPHADLRPHRPRVGLLALVVALLATTLLVVPATPAAADARDLLVPDDGAWFGTFLKPTTGTVRADIEAVYDEREAMLGRTYDIAHHYYQFDEAWPTWREPHFGARGTASMASWAPTESWRINNGSKDAVIRARADAVKAYGDPLFVRYFWEMDGSHHGDKAGSPADFVAAWRRIVDTFRARGADNAIFVWCPTTWGFEVERVDQWYPGDQYVDWLCADGYNFYKIQPTARDREAVDIFTPFHEWGLARGKPMMAGEYGVVEDPEVPGAKADWYDQLRLHADELPGIRAWVYFDTIEDRFNGDNDWRPITSPSARSAYVQLANSAWFTHAGGPLDGVQGAGAGWPGGANTNPTPVTLPATCPDARYLTTVGDGSRNGDGSSYTPALDADGSHVAFSTYARDLHPLDTNGKADVYVVAGNQRNLVSVDVDGGPANHASFLPSLSDDGRYVAFESRASDLVAQDTNGLRDVFVRDLQSGQTRRVSVRDGGGQAVGGESQHAMISGNGRYVVFQSKADNLVSTATPASWDVYRHDLQTGATVLVSRSAAGVAGDGPSTEPSISDDGRFVAFRTQATNLGTGPDADGNGGTADIVVKDLGDGSVQLVTLDRWGDGADGASSHPRISGDASRVAFRSFASDLVAGDTNGMGDVFVTVLASRTTTRASVKPDGGQVNASSHSPAIDQDGSVVAFSTTADIAAGGSGGGDQVHLRTGGDTVALRTDDGSPFGGRSQQAALDDDASHVAVRTDTRNLCAATSDTNNRPDIGLVRR